MSLNPFFHFTEEETKPVLQAAAEFANRFTNPKTGCIDKSMMTGESWKAWIDQLHRLCVIKAVCPALNRTTPFFPLWQERYLNLLELAHKNWDVVEFVAAAGNMPPEKFLILIQSRIDIYENTANNIWAVQKAQTLLSDAERQKISNDAKDMATLSEAWHTRAEVEKKLASKPTSNKPRTASPSNG